MKNPTRSGKKARGWRIYRHHPAITNTKEKSSTFVRKQKQRKIKCLSTSFCLRAGTRGRSCHSSNAGTIKLSRCSLLRRTTGCSCLVTKTVCRSILGTPSINALVESKANTFIDFRVPAVRTLERTLVFDTTKLFYHPYETHLEPWRKSSLNSHR